MKAKFCPKCGKTLVEGQKFCSSCGALVEEGTAERPDEKASEEQAKYIGTIVGHMTSIIICGIAALWAFVTFVNDTSSYWGGYNYQSPLTNHELMVICFGLGGSVGVIVSGIQLLLFVSKNKKE